MSKKEYMKPTMTVVPVNIRTQILAGSGGYDDYNAYAPGMDDNKNLMA